MPSLARLRLIPGGICALTSPSASGAGVAWFLRTGPPLFQTMYRMFMHALSSLLCFIPSRWLVLVALTLLPAAARAQVDIFIKFTPTNAAPTIPGDGTDTHFPGNQGWFVVQDFSLGSTNGVVIQDANPGKTGFLEMSVGKDVNKASPIIFQTLAASQMQGFVQLVLRRSGGTSASSPFLTYEFRNAYFTGQEWGGQAGGAVPSERLRMVYAAFRITYRPQNPDGTLGTAVTGQWNQQNNTATF